MDTWRFWERGVLREEWMKVTDDRGNCYALEEGNYYALVTAGDPPEDGAGQRPGVGRLRALPQRV